MSVPTPPANILTIESAKPSDEVTQHVPEDSAAHRAMALLAQHRVITTPHLHRMLGPSKPRSGTSESLNALRGDKLISYAVLPRSRGTRLWFLTPRGAQVATLWPELRGRSVVPPGNATEASLRAPHTLAGVRAHLAFLDDARARGDEYGALDWVPEIAHRLPDTGGEDRLIADAVMHYTASSPRRLQYRSFVEIDRATMSSERLASKLISYARFHDYTPQPVGRRGLVRDQAAMLAWQRFYPRFPRILFILTGASSRTLQQRTEDLRAMTSEHPLVATLAAKVPLGAAVLEDLETHGPSGPVWMPLSGPAERRSWMEL
ncbi:replication-relaxation family protein [Streptomyces sp. NBC_01422]|uniref:replication-relaxation family protein n=1 Tax=Streptomyces sp. NBC_01422 TaxID=2903859 RepID=UPI002E27BF05|nr:replication-relaxation family protein [Streptomyces sp. NBC_01422]